MQNSLYFHSVGDRLLDAALGARKVFLCSPFIKQSALNKVLSCVDSEAEVTLVTKIDLDSFACGVSDISALREVLSKKGMVLILANLHLKYYRFNRCVFLGSANLTDKGLGWAYKPNVELLVQQMFGEIESLMEETILESSMILDYESLEKFELLLKKYLEHYCRQKNQKQLCDINEKAQLTLVEGIEKRQIVKSEEIKKWIPHEFVSVEQLYLWYSCAARDSDLPKDLVDLGFHAGIASRELFIEQLKRKIRRTGIYQEIVSTFDQTTKERPFLSFGLIRGNLTKYLDSDWEIANRQVNLIYDWFTSYLKDEFFEPQPMTFSRLLGRCQISSQGRTLI